MFKAGYDPPAQNIDGGVYVNVSMKSAAAFMLTAAMLLSPMIVGAQETIPRAASTPDTPKNWVAPSHKIHAQLLVDELLAKHPEIISITIHAVPAGLPADSYSMIAGSFPDRIGNESGPNDILTARHGTTQIESKWGTENWQKKVSAVMPMRDAAGNYLPATIIIAFKTSPNNGKRDTDFLAPAIAIRDGLGKRIPDMASLFAPAR